MTAEIAQTPAPAVATTPRNEALMEEVEKSVEAWMRDRKVTLTPAKRNRLVITFYNHFRSQQPLSN